MVTRNETGPSGKISKSGALHDTSEGGTSGKHREPDLFTIFAGPATTTQTNNIRLGLFPIACWRVNDIRFGFNSSFVAPEIAVELRMLIVLRESHKKSSWYGKAQYPPLSLFGHADASGDDDYNKALSGRRARAVYALIISATEPQKAVSLWLQIAEAEGWGRNHRETMLLETGLPQRTADDSLIRAYMRSLCPVELRISSEDFLAQGVDAGGKGDYQGCSEFNPLLVLSREEDAQFAEAARLQDQDGLRQRDQANEPNRRVLALLFRPGSQVVAANWPCPRVSETVAACHKRFWSDSERRRSTHLSGAQRKFEDMQNTFACRFYQRLTNHSPCERASQSVLVRLYDAFGFTIPFAPYKVAVDAENFGEQQIADARGIIALAGVEIPSSCHIIWGFPADDRTGPHFLFSRTMFLFSETDNSKEAAFKRLNNLGYDSEIQADNILGFQLDYGYETDPPLEPSGTWDRATVELLKVVYTRNKCDLRKTGTY